MSTRLMLAADSAADLMSPNPISISSVATVSEAVGLLVDRGFHAAPVIDEAGRPIGVVSSGDILRHDREYARHLSKIPEFDDRERMDLPGGERLPQRGYQVETVDRTPVREIMTPAIFSVSTNATPEHIVRELAARRVHRLFVVDGAGVLVGVISTLDILRKLKS
ncbi:MAG: CBS domain-containing protein [Gemmataceae bacterium]